MTESTEVVLGGSKRFECRVLGFPRPEIRWYKDGVEITHVKRYNFDFTHDGVISMLMEEISHKDQGMYRCRADNSEGTASTSAYLFVRQRRGLPDEDTMSIHSMTMSEVDTEYEERKQELESYAKRMQVDFGGEDFFDEFGSGRTFEDLVSEENRENQLSSKLGLDEVKKGQKDKTDKSISNGYYEESFSSKQESSYYEESYEESSTKKIKMSKKEEYTSSKSSKTSIESQEESKMSAESSQVAIESSRSEQKSKISTETSIKACQSDSSSSQKISLDAEITSSQIESSSRSASQSESQLLIESSEGSFDNSSSSSRTTVEEGGLRLMSSEVEVDGHGTSREGTLEPETVVETDSAEVDSTLIMESSVEIESKKKRKKRMSVEMEIEEKSTQDFDVESKTTKTKKVEEIKTLTAEMKTMTKDTFPTDMGSVSSIFSLVSEEGAEESLTPLNPSDVLETKIRNKLQAKVLESESRQESGSLEDLVFSEESLTEVRKEEASSRAELRAQLESQAQEASLPQDRLLDIPMDEKEILATSLGHDSGIFDMSMVDTPSHVGESSTEALSESPSLLDSTLTEAQFVSALESKEGDGQSSQATSEKVLSQTDEQNLDQADSSQLTDVSRIESQQVQELDDSDKKRALDKAKLSRETALADEQSVVSDDASAVSNLDSMSAEELSISSQIDMKEALDKARSTQEVALVDEVQDGKEDASIVSDLTDLDSIVADELSVDSQADSKKSRPKSRKEAAFVDEMSNRDDASIVSDLTDLESIRADEMSIDGHSEITEAELKGRETLHTDQVSVAGSEIEDLSELMSVESNLKAKEEETRDSLLTKDSVKIGETVDLLDGPAEEASGVELSDIKGKDLFQEPINEETVSEFSEGSIREASELGLEDAIPSGGQMVTSPSDLTSLVTDAQVASQADPQVSETVQDTIDGALKDLQSDSTKVSEEPNPNKADVGDIPEILEAEAEKVSKKKRTEDQELYFSSEVETTEKKTKKKSAEEELTLTTSVETTEIEISTDESSTTIQADVDVSDIKFDEQGLKMSASVEVEERRFPPEVVKVPEDVSVQAGETIHLMSEVTGNPKPDVKWFKEGEKVCESQRITLVTEDSVYSLEIREAENSDGGTYTLTAHNAEGTILNDVHVNVSVPPGQEDKLIMENENISVTATLSQPKFTKKPEDTTVSEFDQVQFVCEVQGNPEPKVNWLKEGQKLKSDQRMRIYQSDGQHFLEIPQSSILDSGEYECQASNSEGSTSCHVILTVEAATEQESGLSAAEEVPQASESDEFFLKEYVATTSYLDEDTNVTLNVGEIVQVLDSRLTTGCWLVRKQTEKEQVCYVPASILQNAAESTKDISESSSSRKRDIRLSRSPSLRTEHDLETSEDEAGLFHLKETFEVFMVVADFNQSSTDPEELRLVEGQYVEVIDRQRPDMWMVRTKPTKTTPAKQGWVPSGYFDVKTSMVPPIKKDTREQFRDEILHIKNKQQEAMLKRSSDDPFKLKIYVLTELIETEREYIKDLQNLVDTYQGRFSDRDVPDVLKNKQEEIFSNIKPILKFHHDHFLNALTVSSAFPGKTGGVFLKYRDHFMMYIEYLYSREAAGFFLDTEAAKTFYKKYSRSVGRSDNDFPLLLSKGEQRLSTYLTALKDFLKLSQRANDAEGVKEIEKAISMLLEVYKRMEQRKLMETVEGITGDVNEYGQLLRHDDVIMWDAEPSLSRSKERHILLFPEKLILTKRKRPDSATETTNYVYKSVVQLQDIQIYESVEEDDRRFEIWYAEPTSEKLTFQTRSVYAKQAWVRDIREALVNLGIKETDIMAERRIKKQTSPPPPSTPRKKSESSASGSKLEDVDQQSGSESDRTIKSDDYQSLTSYDSDYNTDISSYHTAPEFEDGTSRPIFKRRPKKTVCSEGSAVKLECIVGGLPLPTVVWQKDNETVEESDTCTIVTEGETTTLHLENIDKSQAGQYSVKATNKNATIICSADLLVLEDVGESAEFDRETTPTPQEQEQDQSVKETTPVPEAEEESKLKAEEEAKRKAEEDNLKAEEEAKRKAEEEAKLKAEEEAKRKAEEEAKLKAEEEAKRKAEEEAKRKAEEEAKLKAEEEAKRKAEEEAKLKAEEEAKRKAEEEAKRKAEEEAKRKAEEEAKLKAEEEAKRKAEEEAKRKAEEEAKLKAEEEAKRKAEEEAKLKAEEEAKRKAEEEAKRKAEEEAKRKADEEILKAEEEAKRKAEQEAKRKAEEEAKLKAEEEAKRKAEEDKLKAEEEAKRKAEEDKLKAEEEAKLKAEEESKRKAEEEAKLKAEEEAKRKAEEDKLKAEEAKRKAEEAKLKAEEEAKVKAEEEEAKYKAEEAKCKAEEEAKLKAEEEAKRKAEEEAKLKKEKEAKLKAEEEAKRKAEEEARLKAEEDTKLKAEEEAKLKADKAKLKKEEDTKLEEPKPEEEESKPEFKEEEYKPTEEPKSDELKLKEAPEPKEKPDPKAEELKEEIEPEAKPTEELNKVEELKEPIQGDISYIPEEKLENTAPLVLDKMKDCDIEEGRLARFDCRVCAYPIPEITWEKDGKLVEESSHYKLLQEKDEIYSLLIKDCTISDSGRYTCWARNEYGEAYTESILNVIALDNLLEEGEVKPSFTTRFYDVEVTEGVPAEFVCQVKGDPSPGVKWLLNGEELHQADDILIRQEDDGHQLLAFRNVRLDQAGEITCRLKNDLGEATCTAQLIVKEDPRRHGPELKPPKFIKKPVDCEVSTGEDIKIECTVAGEPEPEVTWYFEDRELFESNRRILRKVGNNHLLKLRNLATMNAGVYTIRAVNPAGEASCTFKIDVNEIEEMEDRPSPKRTVIPETKYGSAPSFASRVQDARVSKGGKARFECRTMGIPQPEVQWFRDSRPVSPSDRIKIGRDATGFFLTVADVSPEDEGEYSCTIKNDSGKASCAARLQIGDPLPATPYQYQPRDKRRPSPLFTTIDAAPPVKRTFVELAPDEKVPTMPIGKPSILEVKPDAAKLSWLPAYTSGLPENAGPCSYTVEARELPGTYWSKLASDVYGTTYFARQLRPDKEYQFRVRAENRFGSSDPSVPATLPKREAESPLRRYTETPEIKEMLARLRDAPPVIPTSQPFITDMGAENVRLAWKPVELPTEKYELPDVTYSIEAQRLPSEEWVPLASRVPETSYYLSDLGYDRDYNIRIRAENQYGRSAPTQSLWLPRATAFPGVPVSRPNIIEMEPDSVRLSWARVDVPSFGYDDEPMTYMIEMQEPPSMDWQTVAQRIPDTSYKVTGLNQGRDYRFRVRPVMTTGKPLEPSPAASLYRTLAQTHVPVDRVQIDDYEPDYESVRLSWRRVEIPPFDVDDEPLLYMIEQNDPRSDYWSPVVSGLPTTSYRIPGISPTDDLRFRVRAITPYGMSPPSHDAGLYQSVSPIRAPADSLRILDMQPEKLRLAWQPTEYKSTEPIRYQIESQHLPSLEWQPLAQDVTDTSYLLSGLKPSQDYRLRVRPQTTSGYLEPTEPVSITNFPVRPRFPIREPSILDVGPTSVELAWKPAEIPMYSRQAIPVTYSIDMQELPGTSWIPVARRIPQTHYLATGLRPDADYSFRIRPETEFGPGEASLPVSLKRRPVITLPHREPVLTNVTPDACELSWQPIQTTSHLPVTYRIEIREPPSTTWKHLSGQFGGTNIPIRFLRPDQDYMFRIVAVSGGMESEPSPPCYLPHRGGPPRMPTNVPYISEVYPDSLLLSWRSVELPARITDYSPVRYNIEVQESPLFQWRPLAHGIPRTQYRVTGLKPDRDYIFRVRAESNYGLSEPTDTITVQRRPVLPTLPTDEPMMMDVRPSSVRLSWRPATIPSYMHDTKIPVSYTIFCQELPDTNWRPIVRRVPHTDYTVMGLAPNRDYAFRVQAENDYGTSKPTLPTRLLRRPDYTLPIEYPEIDEYEPSSLLLSWRQPTLPALKSKPLTYALENYEPIHKKWVPFASKIPDTSYRVSELAPSKDYMFRVRPEIGAEYLEPSLPISYSRKRWLPSVPVERPEIFEMEPESVHVSWRPVRLPGYDMADMPRRFRLEMRDLSGPHWTTVIPSTSDLNYRIRNLDPDTDYAFRVRAVLDDGVSEPSPAVFLHRRPVISRAPLRLPEITSVDDTSVALGWQRVDIPAFEYDQEPMTFLIEGQRLPDYNWRPLARGVTDTSYRVKELDPHGDYHFRIRGESSVGVTEPSPVIPFYRQPVRSGVPIARPTILDEDATTARLRWSPAYIPNYLQSMPKSYVIEKQESPSRTWRPLAKGVTSTDYTVTDLSPRKDYHFRIRAVTPTGRLSEPTPPIPYYRTQLLKYEPLPIYQMPFITEDYSLPNRPYIESLTVKVPPRLSIEKPEMIEITPDTIQLNWNQARVSATTAMMSPTYYRIEVRQPNSFDWREVASGIVGQSHTVRNLNPLWDYAFRVRAINDYGLSEPTLPVFLNRQSDTGVPLEDFDYDSQFGQSVPPKLPIDTPALVDVNDDRLTLKWFPARIPAYAKKAPITYTVEVREPIGPGWRKMISGLTEPTYNVGGLTPKHDYSFRIRAESPFGISEPTLPASITRSKAPVIRRPSFEFERDRDLTSPARSYIDSFTSGVPPRVPAGRPNMTKQAEDRLLLSWQQARMPSYLKNTPITYIVEMREPPSHAWNTLTENLPETHFEVSKLRPEQDYMFRVRAKNEYGMSEPTLPATLFREREEPRPKSSRSGSRDTMSPFRKIRVGTPTSRERSETVERKIDYTPSPPEFLTPSGEDQYAAEARGCKVCADVKGYPLPEITWFFKGEKLEMGGRYNSYTSPVGQIDLEFGAATWDDIGDYKCVAENEHGSASCVIPLKMADPPTFIEPLKDVVLLNRGTGKIECRVDGIPYPTIKFNKDWRPLTETSRVRIHHERPDYFSLTIDGALSMDAGQYTCVAENVAGKIFCSARVEVEDSLPTLCDLNFKNANIEDYYYVMEELGRGRHGVVRRVIEKSTGTEFAAKFITVREDGEKDFFKNELETLRLLSHKNILALHDAYETPKNLIIVTELLPGGNLVDHAIDQNNWTENDVAATVKKLLNTLGHIHSRNILHLDIKPSNILFPTKDSNEIKLIDFGFARKIPSTNEVRMNYGTPDFASPESVNNEVITTASDIWSVGALVYTLLSGTTPFQADSDPEILERIMEGKLTFVPVFDQFSKEAKDFISKLLVVEPTDRLSLEECLNHPWITNVSSNGKGLKLDTNNLKSYRDREQQQTKADAVRTVANLRSLRRLMDGDYSDLGFQPKVDPVTGQITFPDSEAYGEFADEETWYDWQARYQQDAQLQTPHDSDYGLRVRGYRRAAGDMDDTGLPPGVRLDDAVRDILDGDSGTKVKTMKERRTISVDREELPPSIEREMDWLDGVRKHRAMYDPAESSCQSKRSSIASITGEPELPPPIFKTKLQDKAFSCGEDILFKCQVVGPPPPTVTWYRNEELLTDGARIRIDLTDDGVATLLILSAKPYDGGVYKCVARNKYGRATSRARLLAGDVPNRPGRPVVTQITSDSALIIWEAPKSDGNSDILFYKVDYKRLGDERWTTAVKILHECAVVKGLKPDTGYRFRVSCMNQFGMSPYSWSSVQVVTKPSGGEIQLDEEQQLAIAKSHQAEEQLTPGSSRRETKDDTDLLDDSIEEPKLQKSSPESVYKFTDSVWKGKFSDVRHCTNVGTKAERVVKIIPVSSEADAEKDREYSILREVRHNNIARLYDAYFASGKLYLIFERLYGDHIVRQLAYKRRYSEDNVATVIRQVLNALQFLHRIGIAHLNIQPGSVVTASRRHLDVKLIDFGLSQKIPNQDGVMVPRVGYPDFMPPEVIAQERVTETADIWGVAALTFLLLSGESPYSGDCDESTLLNIVYNRYDPHDLYDNISKEALKFIFKIMKRLPRNRLSLQDCLEHKWLLLSDAMVKTRQEAVFLTNKMRKFCKEYDAKRLSPDYRRDFTTFTLSQRKPVKRVKPKSKLSKQEPVVDEPFSDEPQAESDPEQVAVETQPEIVSEETDKPKEEASS